MSSYTKLVVKPEKVNDFLDAFTNMDKCGTCSNYGKCDSFKGCRFEPTEKIIDFIETEIMEIIE